MPYETDGRNVQIGGFKIAPSGIEKFAFLDDRPYVFQPNPHFKHWLPLTSHPNSWIAVRPGKKPRVVYFQPDDYWHVPPSAPEGTPSSRIAARAARS